MVKAVVFDVDGTLVDSVDLHLRAWQAAFREHGFEIEYATLNRLIGETGKDLTRHLLTGDEFEAHGESIVLRAGAIFREQFASRVRPFHGAADLVHRLKE